MVTHTFFCIDGHVCGEPVRVVAAGAPPVQGKTQNERREHFLTEHDWVRASLMLEPRGHDVMAGAILYPPITAESDVAVLFMEPDGYPPMSGHTVMGMVTIAIEHGLVTPKTPGVLRLETPAGMVVADYKRDGQKVTSVKLSSVPAFLYLEGYAFDCPELGWLTVDIAFGGNFFAIVESQENFRDLEDYAPDDLIHLGWLVHTTLNDSLEIVHPENPAICGVRHCLWTGKPTRPEAHGRNVVVYGKKGLDRSPCGTGTCARLAQRFARGWLKADEEFVHESILGSTFIGRIEKTTAVGDFSAIVPSIEGRAFVTGFNTIFVDERDPFARGFQLA